ncbi:MAG TPA: flagellar biosynthetic protein FliO [Tepidisphaeraceae bacterium]|nr:flagellar biosynthetic protein FliO [Tepidisphaeraceae bacterium]
MKGQGPNFVGRETLTCAFVAAVFLAGAALAAPGPATRTAHAADGDPQANSRAVAPPPPNRSETDKQLIRRGGADAGAAGSGLKPTGMELSRVVGALAAVIGLILALKWGGKKLLRTPGAGRTSRAVQVLARSAVSPRQQILLLRVGRRVIVVGDSGSQMNALSEITDADEVAALVGQIQGEKPDLAARAFGAMFRRARGGMEVDEEPEAQPSNDGAAAPGESPPTEPMDAEEAEAATISDTREELNGLMEKVRLMSRQLRNG